MIVADLALNFAVLLAEGGGHHEAAPALQFRPDTGLFTIVIFIILLALLYKYAWKPIMEGLEKRETGLADEIASAKAANEKAQQALREYEGKMAATADEVNAIIASAKKDAEALKEKIISDANEEAKRQKDRAIADINAAKDAAVRELAQKSVDSAVTLAGSLVKKEIDAKAHSKLIDDSLDRFVSNN